MSGGTEFTIAEGLDSLISRFGLPGLPPGGAPVFLLSAGWRSGSTLAQRLLVSSGRLLMWGEPYDHCGLIRSVAESLRSFAAPWPPGSSKGLWPPAGYIVDSHDPPSSGSWIANAYPHPADLLAAHRALFDRLFAHPAAEMGFELWGIKEVRLDGEHALYLKTLYPDARLVFLHRNPWDAWLSYRRRHDERASAYWWFRRWPDEEVSTPADFGAIWQRMAESFLTWGPVLGAATIAYESMVRGESLDALEWAAGAEVDGSVLRKRLGGSPADRRDGRPRLEAAEAAEIATAVGGTAVRLGYTGPTEGVA
ncbi:MAG: sulfotransferase [Actinobacteria bacterium]|nr:sulfotransferase [Actinomycetota bacterium]MBU1493018.1 sulfotransferase [Actinomycetota bacterium]MBU1866588.1 sulfotransferase [Actinomycetota bacterium]